MSRISDPSGVLVARAGHDELTGTIPAVQMRELVERMSKSSGLR